jgi:sarcosine oxidase delta subunit
MIRYNDISFHKGANKEERRQLSSCAKYLRILQEEVSHDTLWTQKILTELALQLPQEIHQQIERELMESLISSRQHTIITFR